MSLAATPLVSAGLPLELAGQPAQPGGHGDSALLHGRLAGCVADEQMLDDKWM